MRKWIISDQHKWLIYLEHTAFHWPQALLGLTHFAFPMAPCTLSSHVIDEEMQAQQSPHSLPPSLLQLLPGISTMTSQHWPPGL